MRRVTFLLTAIALLSTTLLAVPARAIAQRAAIEQIKLETSTDESGASLIIGNISDQLIKLDGWAIEYASGDAKLTNEECMAVDWRAYGTDSQIFTVAIEGEIPVDGSVLISALPIEAGKAGTLRLLSDYSIDGASVLEDMVGWNRNDHKALCFEAAPVAMPDDGLLQRQRIDGQLIDTNDNQADFSLIDEEEPPVIDVCDGLGGNQSELPLGYRYDGDGHCVAESAKVIITELLPNSDSYDSGNEFIELYNPNDFSVNLGGYKLLVGPDLDEAYQLSQLEVEAKSYVVLRDDEVGFGLTNTASRARLVAPAGNTVSLVEGYEDAKEAEAWAFINDSWQYTDRPTPGEANLASRPVEVDNDDDESDLKPCNPNQFRNPETNRCKLKASVSDDLEPCNDNQFRNPATNRCKLIVSASDQLKPCDTNQFRNPETNRCKLINSATSQLKPCDANEFRNPETNRCKDILSASSDLKPCDPGEERNPETNRCRQAPAPATTIGSITAKRFSGDSSQIPYGPLILSATGVAALGYGFYEWRNELWSFGRKIFGIFGHK